MADLRAGNIWSLVVIDHNFTKSLANTYFNDKLLDGFDQAIHVYSDNTSKTNIIFTSI